MYDNTKENKTIGDMMKLDSLRRGGEGPAPRNVRPEIPFDPRPIEEQRGILTPPRGPQGGGLPLERNPVFPNEPDTVFNPPTTIDRKYGAKGSGYMHGAPVRSDVITSDVPHFLGEGQADINTKTGEVTRTPSLPEGRELPAMILRDEPGYEEDNIG